MKLYDLLTGAVSQEEYLNYNNATIIYEKLPKNINGYVFNYDNINFITINNSLSYYKKKKTLLHELAHIELNQLNQIDRDLFEFKIDRYEDEADIYLKMLLDKE